MSESSAARDADRLLSVYLRDHRAGAEAGLALIRRCRRANERTVLGKLLAQLEVEISEDRAALALIMNRLDVRENRVKKVAARVAAAAGRLKVNGRLRGYSPSSRVLELEALMAGIDAKRGMWLSLRSVASRRRELDDGALEQLVERATAQRTRLATEHHRAATIAFGGD